MRSRLIPVLGLFLVTGCGGGPSDQPDIGRVTGTVKMDGAPLPNANVQFQPEKGRPSFGKTDDSGVYELTYSASTKGAKIGKHKVTITTAGETEDGTAIPEKVPDTYNSQTTLSAEVKSGSNEINFEDLDSSKGTIVQPSGNTDDGC